MLSLHHYGKICVGLTMQFMSMLNTSILCVSALNRMMWKKNAKVTCSQ